MDPNALSRLMSRYTQKCPPNHRQHNTLLVNSSESSAVSTPHKPEVKEEISINCASSFIQNPKSLTHKSHFHPKFRKLNKREIEVRTKILSTIISEGDLKSVF